MRRNVLTLSKVMLFTLAVPHAVCKSFAFLPTGYRNALLLDVGGLTLTWCE